MVQYLCIKLHPGSSRGVFVLGPVVVAQAFLPALFSVQQIPKLNSKETLMKDRSNLCAFTFADGRQCRSLRRSGHPRLCYEHAKKEAEALFARQAGADLASLLCGRPLSPADSAAALARVLSAVAGGYIKPKTALSLAFLGQTLNESIKLAQDEYTNAPGGNARREPVASCLLLPAPPEPTSQLAPAPQPDHSAAPEPNPQSPPQPAPLQLPNHLESTLTKCSKNAPLTIFRINTSSGVDSKAT